MAVSAFQTHSGFVLVMAWNCSLANGRTETSRSVARRAGRSGAADVGDLGDPDPAGAVGDRQLSEA